MDKSNTVGRLSVVTYALSIALSITIAASEASAQVVGIGQGGGPGTESDTDLSVYDPFFSNLAAPTEEALFFNASLSDLTLGSGNTTNPGDAGDIFLEQGTGTAAVAINGSSALLRLGTTSNAGDISVRNSSNATSFSVAGSTGNVTNILAGNGLVKAWARIDSSGTVVACYRCSTSSADTQLVTGVFPDFYEVDFTPLGTDISSRPRLVTLDNQTAVFQTPTAADVATRSGDASTVAIRFSSTADVLHDFTIIIF